MNLRITQPVKALFPELRIGCLYLNGIDNQGAHAALHDEARRLAQDLRKTFPTVEHLTQHPRIQQWKDAYRLNKSKPSKYRPTVEALLRRIVKGSEIPLINSVVTAYLIAELEYLHPIGGYDMATLTGDVQLRTSSGDEPFQGIGTDQEHTYEGEIIYSDDREVLTRRWNFRDCTACQVTQKSRDVVLMTEVIDETVSDQEIIDCLTRAGELTKQFCGGSYRIDIVNT